VPKTEPDTTANYIDIAGQVESLEQSDANPIGKANTHLLFIVYCFDFLYRAYIN